MEIDNLINAFWEFLDARSDYKEKAKKVEYDRGYFLHDEKERINDAKKELANQLELLIKKVK